MGSVFKKYLNSNLLARIVIGLILGSICGIILGFFSDFVPTYVKYVQFLGDIFIRLLKMIVVPVVLFSIICGAASIDPAKLGRIGVKILIYYLVTSAFAIIVGLFFANILKPGLNFNIQGSASTSVAISESPSIVQIFLNIIPTNPIKAIANGDMLPIIFFAMLFGFAISYIRDSKNDLVKNSADTIFYVCNGGAEAMYKIVSGIMQYAPIGVFALISIVFAQQGAKAIGPLFMITFSCYVAFIVQFVVVYGFILRVFGRVNPFTFFKKINEVVVTAFVTRSSSGTLPVTLRVAENELKIPRSIASFSLPLGATINMNGTAIYLGICCMFIGFAINQPLLLGQQITVIITATLAAIGTAGVPGAGPVMLLLVLDSIGLKLTEGSNVAVAYAMILGIDALLDMGRTCLNVTGDIVGTYIICKQDGELL